MGRTRIQVGGGLVQCQDAAVQAKGLRQGQPDDQAGQHLQVGGQGGAGMGWVGTAMNQSAARGWERRQVLLTGASALHMYSTAGPAGSRVGARPTRAARHPNRQPEGGRWAGLQYLPPPLLSYPTLACAILLIYTEGLRCWNIGARPHPPPLPPRHPSPTRPTFCPAEQRPRMSSSAPPVCITTR